MRKLSEVKEASKARRARNREDQIKRLDRLNAWMDELEAANVPCNNPHMNMSRDRVRSYVRSGAYGPVGIECDECGTEMVDLHEAIMTMPPRAKIQCPGCGITATVDPKDLT